MERSQGSMVTLIGSDHVSRGTGNVRDRRGTTLGKSSSPTTLRPARTSSASTARRRPDFCTRKQAHASRFSRRRCSPSSVARGCAGKLLGEVLVMLRAEGRTVTLTCPFAAAFVHSHPEYADLVDPTFPGNRTLARGRPHALNPISGDEPPGRDKCCDYPCNGRGTVAARWASTDKHMVDHKDVVSLASLGLDGGLPADGAAHLAEHVRNCRDCAVYVQQLASTKALMSARALRNDDQSPVTAEEASAQNHQALVAIARASDPAHADDLVQEVWDHYLGRSQGALPNRSELLEYLLQHLDEHQRDEDSDRDVWADSLLHQHRHNPAELSELDLPADPGAQQSLRELADLDQLDADADTAELFYPDFYEDGADGITWGSPPTAWPTLRRILGPEAELSTDELYSQLDAAFDELPEHVADVVNLVDLEGYSLEQAMSLFALSRRDAERYLVIGRNHLRGRINTYLVADPVT